MLTYADRLISMSTPGFGLHKDYRNDIHDVVRFFHMYHYGKFRVYNLCEGYFVYNYCITALPAQKFKY